MRNTLVFSLVLATTGGVPTSWARTNFLEMSLEELIKVKITVASTTQETLFDSVSTVSIISRSDLDRYGYRTVGQALETAPGFDVIRSYIFKDVPVARGVLPESYANKILFMINNVPLWSGVTGEPVIERINIQDVERIEILRGPASVQYGTNAYSGAVNVVLRDEAQTGGRVYVGLGSQSWRGGGASYSYRGERGQGYVAVSQFDEDGQRYPFRGENYFNGSDLTDQATLQDQQNIRNATAYYQYSDHHLLINLFDQEDNRFGARITMESGAGRTTDRTGSAIHYKFDHEIAENERLIASVQYDEHERAFSSLTTSTDVGGYRSSAHLKYLSRLLDHYDAEIGADYDYRYADRYRGFGFRTGITTDPNMAGQSIYEYSTFGQLGRQLNTQHRWQLGIRQSENELFGSNTSASATWIYQLDDANVIKFIWGQSYRAPSLFESFFVSGVASVFGNPELKPETAETYEITYLTSIDHSAEWLINVNVYHSIYEDKVFRNFGDIIDAEGNAQTRVNYYDNADTFSANGIEVELRYASPSQVTLFVNGSYVDGGDGDSVIDPVTGKDDYNFKYAPDFSAATGIAKAWNQWTFSAVARYRASAESGLIQQSVDASTVVDATLSYQHQASDLYKTGLASVTHRLRCENIFDEQPAMPEYVRGNIDELYLETEPRLLYQIELEY